MFAAQWNSSFRIRRSADSAPGKTFSGLDGDLKTRYALTIDLRIQRGLEAGRGFLIQCAPARMVALRRRQVWLDLSKRLWRGPQYDRRQNDQRKQHFPIEQN